MNTIFSIIIALMIIGGVVVVAGREMNIKDILSATETATNQANLHQLSTALELYYLTEGKYPEASNSGAFSDILFEKGYLTKKLENTDDFLYEARNDGQDYSLKIRE